MPAVSRIVEIGSPARLSFKDLQLRIEREGCAPAQVPIEDLGVLVLDYAQTTVTVPLLSALAAAGVAVAVCGQKHMPDGLLLPIAGSALHARTLRGQIAASLPRTKRIWQGIVQAKIAEQARALVEVTGKDGGLTALVTRVGSGDPKNLEGAAARAYFPAMFGRDFRRDPEGPGLNVMLNYGYSLIRAACARAIVGAGLHPAIGVHHCNQYDAFALADDVMEPMRPLVDLRVRALATEAATCLELTPMVKRALLEVLTADVAWGGKRFPLLTALGYYAANVRDYLLGEENRLRCPGR